MVELFPSLNLKDVVKSNDEDEEGEEEEEVEVGAELIIIKELVHKEVVRAETIDKVIAKVVANTKAMDSEAVENQEATQAEFMRSNFVVFSSPFL